jgi:hypothetical protein
MVSLSIVGTSIGAADAISMQEKPPGCRGSGESCRSFQKVSTFEIVHVALRMLECKRAAYRLQVVDKQRPRRRYECQRQIEQVCFFELTGSPRTWFTSRHSHHITSSLGRKDLWSPTGQPADVRFWPLADISFCTANVRFLHRADTPSHATQRGLSSKTRPCVAHGVHHSYLRVCTPFLNVFVCPLAEGLNHRVIRYK